MTPTNHISTTEEREQRGGEAMSDFPEEVLVIARKLIAAEVSPEYRYSYMSGKMDEHGAIKAACKGIIAERERNITCSVSEMKTSAGADYFVSIKCDGREITPHMFKERWKAEYEVAEWKWLFGQGEKPDLMAYGPEVEEA